MAPMAAKWVGKRKFKALPNFRCPEDGRKAHRASTPASGEEST